MPKSSITTNHCIEKSSVSRPLLRPKSLGLASRSTSKFEYLNSQSETLDWWIADSFWIGFGSWTAVFALKLNLSKEKNELCLLSYVSRMQILTFIDLPRIHQQRTKKRVFELCKTCECSVNRKRNVFICSESAQVYAPLNHQWLQ